MANRRGVLSQVWYNFIKSLSPRPKPKFMGKDHIGNVYYEAEKVDNKRPSRWYDAPSKDEWEEIPPEWEAWLRGRRPIPPTQDEIDKNLAVIELKKQRALEIESKWKQVSSSSNDLDHQIKPDSGGQKSFPKYSEYEAQPGKGLPNHQPTKDQT